MTVYGDEIFCGNGSYKRYATFVKVYFFVIECKVMTFQSPEICT